MSELDPSLLKEGILEIIQNPVHWHSDSPDQPTCAKCKKKIRDIPLRLWTDNGNLELDFHIECALKVK